MSSPRRTRARGAILIAALAFTMLATVRWVLVPYRVEGPSMSPSLEDGDVVLVNRLAYLFERPGRGEVVIRKPPESSAANGGTEGEPKPDAVKRIAGLPGETVEIRDGALCACGVPAKLRPGLDEPEVVRKGPFGRSPVALGSDEYFLLGDASRISKDSRRWGPARREEIEGRVVLVLLPLERFGLVR
jgi:signal peptidase I